MEFPCSTVDLNIEVLLNGQSFRFAKIKSNGDYPVIQGICRDRIWRFQRTSPESISYRVLGRFNNASEAEDYSTIEDYFQLNVNLKELYDQWSEVDENFKTQLTTNFDNLSGIRVLKQDILETFFAFLCSSNNNIKRIQGMVNSLCELYGDRLDFEVDGKVQTFYNFPTLSSLYEHRGSMESILKERKFGYRADWIAKAVVKLHQLGGTQYLEDLKSLTYSQARNRLINNFTGIGKKVADCICLMGLQKNQVVPIDTHVYKISSTRYLPNLPKEYSKCSVRDFEAIQDFWAERFGDFAGWAQCTLFTNQLSAFKQPKKRART